ncbi:hypothetical protein RHGRI_019818 [Rhododendron griersonianum]|uniref:MULE transposase domain-containing protein n=1 Tax=Rhododendron griersonianum TaxID=479676 RepID=A0AAV6JIM1_9ERIC|nr:hypothetical protein RHGRI_019818 [Rhododendron griersonianum]
MDVSSDLDVIEMFGFYCNVCVLDLHVEVCAVEGPPFPYIPSTTDTTLSFPSVSTNPHECVNVEDDSSDNEWSENSLDTSDKEVEWDNESSEEFIGYGFEEDIEVSSDGMSEYSSGDDGGKESSSDSDIITYGSTFQPFDPTKCGEEFQVDARGKIRLDAASRIQLYRAKRKALEVIEGNHSDSYPLLTTYASKAMRTGFMEGCRPFIGIDGCHLKGPFGGVLLAAVALDGNNGLFPIAMGVVESEGIDSWAFFIDHLHAVIGAGAHARAWTFMSDQQKGLDKVIAEMVPEATHRTCARHLFHNFKKKHPGLLLKKYFLQAVRAYNELEFGYAMESVKSISVEAHKWLSEVSTVWSRHAFNEAVKNDLITNNLAESFNHWVGPLRFKPVLTMLEGIRTKLMTRLQKRHAATALTHKRANLEDYCDMYFHKDYYLKAHGGIIHPIPDQTRWINVGGDTVEPPPLRRLPGRPRKSRRRDVDELEAGTSQSRRSQTVKCSICLEFGHNKRSCQKAPVRRRIASRIEATPTAAERQRKRNGLEQGKRKSYGTWQRKGKIKGQGQQQQIATEVKLRWFWS